MPGPPPKPTALRIYEGNRGHQKLNDREPTPLIGAPEMPKHLTPIARKEWRRLVPLLLSMRVLSEADGVALAILCQAYGTLIEAQSLMVRSAKGTQSQLLIKTQTGYVMQSPLLSIINAQAEIVSRMLQQFGMTPASRSRIATTAGDVIPGSWNDPLERKLCGD
ncbi:MAG TPA: phage terminase small subunit P27 family [Edaphobacter sp.]|nr:phage terminase small subunit P27 family [Edaphobacter sp.]